MLREIVRTETPFVGICFGHQLLAQALGGTVRKADVGWGIGAKEYAVHATKEWMDPPRDVIRLAASHQDQVIDVPADATVWADSDYCPNGGMFVGERAWTLQVHPEFSPALADSLLATRTALFGEEPAAAARATLTQASLDQDLLARWMSAFFHGD
jgi:GMP synthase-like glutamine amidotransferase